MDIGSLKELGLTGNEARVYTSLLELGSAPAVELIRKTGFHRNIVYDNLSKLREKGLVGNIKKGKKTLFQAMPPHNIIKFIEEREKEIENQKSIAQKLVREITKLQTQSAKKEEVMVYYGYKGVVTVLEQLLKEKQDIYAFGASAKLVEGIQTFYKYFFPRWHKMRHENKITLNIIYSEDNRERGEYIKNIPATKVKFLPQEFGAPISTAVCGEVALIVTFGKEPCALFMRSSEISQGIRTYFKTLWSIATP